MRRRPLAGLQLGYRVAAHARLHVRRARCPGEGQLDFTWLRDESLELTARIAPALSPALQQVLHDHPVMQSTHIMGWLAQYEATGDRRLLDLAIRHGAHLRANAVTEKGALFELLQAGRIDARLRGQAIAPN